MTNPVFDDDGLEVKHTRSKTKDGRDAMNVMSVVECLLYFQDLAMELRCLML